MPGLVVTLLGEDDELAFVRRIFFLNRRHLHLVRAHFGEDLLLARDGACFALGHVAALAETGEQVRLELSGIREFERPVQAPSGTAAPLGELSSGDFAAIAWEGTVHATGFAEDHRIPFPVAEKTAEEIAVIAAYGARCAVTHYRATTAAEATGRLDVVYLRPAELGGSFEVANALPVDAAIAYAIRLGHIVFGDAGEVIVRKPLPVNPPTPLRAILLTPDDPNGRPSPDSVRFHRVLHENS